MQKFLSKRDQFVAGKPVKDGDVVEVEASAVSYLISRGWLVEHTETAKKSGNKAANKPAATEPAAAPAATEPTPEPETKDEAAE
jgi:hypothetical protein